MSLFHCHPLCRCCGRAPHMVAISHPSYSPSSSALPLGASHGRRQQGAAIGAVRCCFHHHFTRLVHFRHRPLLTRDCSSLRLVCKLPDLEKFMKMSSSI